MKWLPLLAFLVAPGSVAAQALDYVRPTPPLQTLPPDGQPRVVPPPPLDRIIKPVQPSPQTVVASPEDTWQPKLLKRDGIVLLPAGATFPVKVYQSTLITAQGELPLALEVSEDVINGEGKLVIPKGSRVQGAFKSTVREYQERQRSSYKVVTKKVIQGHFFVAQHVTIGTQTYDLDAISYPLGIQPDPRVAGDDPALKGGAYGLAGGVALGIATGGLALPLVLLGSAVGAVTGGAPTPTIPLEPNQPLTLTLQAPLKGQPQT
ncbi:hypothetical protein [Anthocerotibacter panamensis]|uniref:hypothetical protein n=1 Tax=Anthocerotibacter panamensis TaxID=2857077 RepID=UPI001C40864F|nr:hypothetical protein [Anthocerotibacter panamensis]